MKQDWVLWQFADSAFPAGGFAHSAGLEAAWRQGAWPDGVVVKALFADLTQQIARANLPLVNVVCNDLHCYELADERAHVSLTNHVARRASVAQGQAMLTAAKRIFSNAELKAWCETVSATNAHGHLAPVFGGVARLLGLAGSEARRIFLFMALRSATSAAIRLGRIGPIEAQAVIAQLGAETIGLADELAGAGLDDVVQTLPLLELMQANQDRLYSRLFQS